MNNPLKMTNFNLKNDWDLKYRRALVLTWIDDLITLSRLFGLKKKEEEKDWLKYQLLRAHNRYSPDNLHYRCIEEFSLSYSFFSFVYIYLEIHGIMSTIEVTSKKITRYHNSPAKVWIFSIDISSFTALHSSKFHSHVSYIL